MESRARPAGPILDELGVTLDMGDTDRITEVVVIAKCTDLDSGDVGIILGSNESLDWIAQRGLLAVAQSTIDQQPIEIDDEDE